MAWTVPITSYGLYRLGKSKGSMRALIFLFDSASQNRGIIIFRSNDQNLADARDSDIGGGKRQVIFEMYEQEYNGVVDLLRNEKPVSLDYSNPTFVYLYTSKTEKVGVNDLD